MALAEGVATGPDRASIEPGTIRVRPRIHPITPDFSRDGHGGGLPWKAIGRQIAFWDFRE